MIKQLTLAATAMAIAVSGLAATPAAAQRYDDQRYAYDQAYRDGYNRPVDYQDRRDYRDDRRDYRRDDGRRDDGRRYYNQSRCRSGSTGTILGAIAGGLLGNGLAGRGDRTLGTVLGAGGGALAGRAIDRNGQRYNCR